MLNIKNSRRVELICDDCDKKFIVYKSQTVTKRRGEVITRRFCSRECAIKSEAKKKYGMFICYYCNKQFKALLNIRVNRNHTFCNRTCYHNFRKENRKLSVKVSKNIGRAIGRSLKNREKAGRRWEKLVNFSLEDLIYHIEQKFQGSMSWGNYGKGGWHLDHIKPISSFNFEVVEDEDFKKCWCLENLQPLWEIDNLRKANKLNWKEER